MDIYNCNDLALKKVEIEGEVIGKFGIFEIAQTYINDTRETLEVTYTFPLSSTGTVIGFEVEVGKNVFHGVCKEQQEAKKEYTDNIYAGNSAYMLEKSADNVFKIYVGKVARKEKVTVRIKYIDKFDITDNTIKVLIPTLFYPRYNPTKVILNMSEIVYSKVDYTVDFHIKINKNLNRKSISSPSHGIKLIDNGIDEIVEVVNADLSKEFLLDIELKEESQTSAICYQNKDFENIVYLSYMPEIESTLEDEPKDYLFLLDVSGSMSGSKIDAMKKAVKNCISKLDVGDTFNIIPFESDYTAMNIESVEATEENIKNAQYYVDSLRANGGTEILRPIQFALYEKDVEKVIMLFTDGQVYNDDEIYNFIENNISNSRIFPFGIDNNINESFIKKLAKYGRGKYELIYPGENIEDKIIRAFDRIQSPKIEGLKIDYGKNKVIDEIKEESVLYNFEYFNVFAKLGEIVDDIKLKGSIRGEEFELVIDKDKIKETDFDLELVYEKSVIDKLYEYVRQRSLDGTEEEYKKKIIEISTKYNIDSKFTSFITVYERKDKIFEVPQHQVTTLSNGFIEASSIPMRGFALRKRTSAINDIKSKMMGTSDFMMRDAEMLSMAEDVFEEDITVKDKKEIQKYYAEFKKLRSKSILTYILLAIFMLEYDKAFDFEKFIKELTKKEKTIKEDSYQKLLYYYYKLLDSLNKKDVQSRIKDMLGDKYKKALETNFNINLDIIDLLENEFKIRKISKEEAEKIIEENKISENVDSILFYLIASHGMC